MFFPKELLYLCLDIFQTNLKFFWNFCFFPDDCVPGRLIRMHAGLSVHAVLEQIRKTSRAHPEHVWIFCGTFPEHVRKKSGKFPEQIR